MATGKTVLLLNEVDGELQAMQDEGTAEEILKSAGPGVVPVWGSAPSGGGLQNLLTNSELGCWSNGTSLLGADNLGPDDWYKVHNTLDLARETSSTYIEGPQGMKVTKGADTAEYIEWNFEAREQQWFLDMLKGRTVTMGAWVYDSQASNTRLQIYDNVGTASSIYHSGNSTKEWLEVTRTIDASATVIRIRLRFNLLSGNTSYISRPMLSFGASIGEGNWVPRLPEIIMFEEASPIFLNYNNVSISADTYIELAVELGGKVPENVKAIHLTYEGEVTTTAKRIKFGDNPNWDDAGSSLQLNSQVANNRIARSGWVRISVDYFDFEVIRESTWANSTLRCDGVLLG
jgi:hypothetical protein